MDLSNEQRSRKVAHNDYETFLARCKCFLVSGLMLFKIAFVLVLHFVPFIKNPQTGSDSCLRYKIGIKGEFSWTGYTY